MATWMLRCRCRCRSRSRCWVQHRTGMIHTWNSRLVRVWRVIVILVLVLVLVMVVVLVLVVLWAMAIRRQARETRREVR